jgi:hypothetical protein
MFSGLVGVFFVPVMEVDYGVVSNLLDGGGFGEWNICGKMFPTNSI